MSRSAQDGVHLKAMPLYRRLLPCFQQIEIEMNVHCLEALRSLFLWLVSLLHCISSRSGFGFLPLIFHKKILTVRLSWQRVPVSLLRAVAAERFLCLLPFLSCYLFFLHVALGLIAYAFCLCINSADGN